MATSKTNQNSTTATARAASPKPVNITNVGEPARGFGNRVETVPPTSDAHQLIRGRGLEAGENNGLRPPRSTGHPSPSPTRFHPQPISSVPPAVTIHAPQSPPKNKKLNLTLSNSSTYLSTDAPLSASSGGSSPRHFRIPSRPNTPLLDSKKSPNPPPSPPPPRRSGEIRRESSFKGAPPPVNRAEKPKISSKSITLSAHTTEATTLAPVPVRPAISPFSTPPSSEDSPEHEYPGPSLPRNRPWGTPEPPSAPVGGQKTFEPPPVHYSVVSKRKDQEANGLGRSIMSPQVTGDGPPPLPIRPQQTSEKANGRPFPPSSMMPPPPPRASMDRSRAPAAAVSDDSPTYQTPPKRVFSHPTQQQLQTPPRSHGRSMTVDRTSDRTPAEFRITPNTTVYKPESRPSIDVAPVTSQIKEALSLNPGEYPDTTHSNRRPPCFKQGVHEIATKYDTRIFDVCGEFVCTSGHITRVWSLLDGGNIMTLSHTEGVKIMSVAFKPARDISEEGSRLWLGNNIGELFEVDIPTQNIVASKASAHTRREIIKIYRHLNEMWTLDDGGTLHLWAPDNTGSPSLSNPYQSFRVPKGHTFSFLVGDELWIAAGKDIRIFMPTLDSSTQFQVLQRPLHQASAGEITSGTTIPTHPDRVYLGHVDGKVSIYSRDDYSCLGIINVSVYKITALAGVGSNLWVGFSTGMIYVYDTAQSPWVVRKEWQAHPAHPLISMVIDRSSFWSLDRAQVVSLGQDNMIRPWDGMLQDDWLGKVHLHAHMSYY